MREATVTKQTNGEQSDFYVEIPLGQQGRAAPPLYDGYKEIFVTITSVSLDEKRTRAVTDRIRNCAARMLCFLNYRLARVERPEEGIRYSRAEFQELFRYEYGLDIIEIAQSLLIGCGLVFPPEQGASTDRSFYWRIDTIRLRQAFARIVSSPKERTTLRFPSKKKSHLILVGAEEHVSEDQPKDGSCEPGGTFCDQKLMNGNSDTRKSMTELHNNHGVISANANDDIHDCNKKIIRELQENKDHSFIPSEQKEDEKIDYSPSKEIKQRIQKPLIVPLETEKIIFEFQNASETSETVMAFFDRLRGYQLTGKLLHCAKEKACELCYGDEKAGKAGYSLLTIMLTTIYLLKHDPKWQENYELYCGRTGIPDVWAVNKWIGAKWPLALRRLLKTGEYVRMDDGALLSHADYQAMLERELEEWQQENQGEVSVSEPSLVETMEDEPMESAEVLEQETQPASVPLETDEVDRDAEPEGFPTLYVAMLHSNRLRRVLPSYFQVEVQPVRDELFEIVILNTCAEDVTVLTCNKQVCEVLRVIQEGRATHM